jgi:hypothetical protein
MTGWGEIETELRLAEVEQATRETLLASGRTFPDAPRDLTPEEIRAQTYWADLDAQHTRAVCDIVAITNPLRAATIEALQSVLTMPNAGWVVGHLQALADPTSAVTLPQITNALTTADALIAQRLFTEATISAEGVLAEAVRQGINPARLPPTVDVSWLHELLRHHARRVTVADPARLLGIAADAALRNAHLAGEPLRRAVARAMRDASTAPVRDLASQAAGSAQGLGRIAGAEVAPDPRRVIASELLDRNTCGPCGNIDGHEYRTLAVARADYPSGYYRLCEGGSRCRGTLVFIHDDEAPATV